MLGDRRDVTLADERFGAILHFELAHSDEEHPLSLLSPQRRSGALVQCSVVQAQ